MEEMHLYNVAQNVEGGIPIYGYQNASSRQDVPLYFDALDQDDGMFANLRVGKSKATIRVAADTKIIYEDGKYRFGEEING